MRRRASFALVGARIFAFACSIASAVLLARLLLPSGYSTYGSGLAVAGFVTLMGPLGVDQVLLTGRTTVARAQAALGRLFLFTSSAVVLSSYLWPGVNTAARITILWLGLSAAADHVRRGWYAEPQQRLRFGVRARREVAVIGALTFATVTTALVTRSAVDAAEANALASLALCLPLIGWFRAAKRADRSFESGRPQLRPWPKIIRAGLPFALSSASYTAYLQLGGAMLVALGRPLDVAYYRVVWTLFAGAIVIPVTLNNDIMRPRIYALRSGDGFISLLVRFAAINVGLSAGYAVGLLTLGPWLIPTVFGNAYIPSAGLLPWLAALIPLNFISTCLANGLVGIGVVWRVVANQGFVLVVCAIASALLIPSRGALGALEALAIAEGVGLFGVLILLRLSTQNFNPTTPTPAVACPAGRD